MSDLEQKIDAIAKLALAENSDERKKARSNLLNLMNGTSSAIKKDAETITREILVELGAPDHLLGHRYVVEAILLAVKDWRFIDNITFGLYPTLAAKFDTTATRVERAIRHVVETVFDRCDMDVMTRYFGNTVSASKGKPANAEFIARIANVVKQRMKESA